MFRRIFLLELVLLSVALANGYEVIYAINCGGDDQLSSNNIFFHKDPGPCDNPNTTVGDYGVPGGLPYSDGIVFRTVRISKTPFTYEAPIPGDGRYGIVFKFFEAPGVLSSTSTKVEDHRHINCFLNGIQVIDGLDILNEYGSSVAVEIHKYFEVKRGNLVFHKQTSGINKKKLKVQVSQKGKQAAIISGLLLVKLNNDELLPKKSWLATSYGSNCEKRCSQQLLSMLERESKKYCEYEYYDDDDVVSAKNATSSAGSLKTKTTVKANSTTTVKPK